MKTLTLILAVCAFIFLESCVNQGDIRVQNKITQVKIMNVKWGDIYIATELMPGETSQKLTIDAYEEKLPGIHGLSFIMFANNKSIYLETVQEYLLDVDGDLLIVLTDSTKVKNPNE